MQLSSSKTIFEIPTQLQPQAYHTTHSTKHHKTLKTNINLAATHTINNKLYVSC